MTMTVNQESKLYHEMREKGWKEDVNDDEIIGFYKMINGVVGIVRFYSKETGKSIQYNGREITDLRASR